jgi:hypothetical protein
VIILDCARNAIFLDLLPVDFWNQRPSRENASHQILLLPLRYKLIRFIVAGMNPLNRGSRQYGYSECCVDLSNRE